MALHCEGRTDRRFLEPLLRRPLVHYVAQNCHTAIDVAEQFVDLSVTSRELQHVVERIIGAESAIDLIFVHADGGNDPNAARQQHFNPIVEAIGRLDFGQRLGFVAVVPVREMEAWLLADPEAIRGAFGTTRSANELGLPPNAHDVEGVGDPKGLMENAYRAVGRLRRGRRPTKTYKAFLGLLGEQVDLGRLEEVPAFRRFQQDLATALRLIIPHAF